MKKASWIVLVMAVAPLVLGSASSMAISYWASPSADLITPSAALDSLEIDREVATALRGRRGTAAALGLAWATLLLWVVLGPYRKGQTWAWWAILTSVAVFAAGGALRLPSLGTSQGVSSGVILLVIVVAGLLLDVRRVLPGDRSAR